MRVEDFILINNAFSLHQKATDWKNAIKRGTDILERLDCVKACYCQSIIDSVETLGPYFVIIPGVAMPHNRPQSGAKKTGCSLVTLSAPVAIKDDPEAAVDVLLTLSARDKKEMTESLIVQIIELFDTPDALSAIRNARTKEDLQQAFALVKEWRRALFQRMAHEDTGNLRFRIGKQFCAGTED